MNQVLIQNWNACVSERDDVYILGDFLYRGTGKDANNILSKLKGKKYLIRGNHDKFLKEQDFDSSLFEWIEDYYILNHEKQKYILFHYPILEWQGYFKDTVHLYGHVHNCGKDGAQRDRLKTLGKFAYNVGVDVNNFFPVSIKQINSVIEHGGQICD